MTFSTLFMLFLILLLSVMFMYKQRIETFYTFKHLVEGDSLISQQGSYTESIQPHLLDILSTSSSKPGKICIESDTDRICLDKSAAISAYTVTEHKDNVDQTLTRLENNLDQISSWKKGTGTATKRLVTYLSKQYYPKEVTYTQTEMNDKFITNVPAQKYLQFVEGGRTFLPTDYDKDGYRYLLNIDSRTRYYPHPGLSNEYITYSIADEKLEPQVVPENVDDPRYSTDQFVTMNYLNQYAPFRLYKTDLAFKLSETLMEQKRRYNEEIALLQQRRANEQTLLSETKASMLADIEQTKNKCDSKKASDYLKEIGDYQIKAESLYGSMQTDIDRLNDRPSVVVQDANYALTQIREQQGFATNALPIIDKYQSSIPGFIRDIQAAQTMIELTTIQQKYVDMIKNCEQYIINMNTGTTISKAAHDTIDARKSTLKSQLDEEVANAQRVNKINSICSQISTMIASSNILNFETIIMNIESEITTMRNMLYQNGSSTEFVPGISRSEGENLVRIINQIVEILNTIKAKKLLAESEKTKIIQAGYSCNQSNTTSAIATQFLNTAQTSSDKFKQLLQECITARDTIAPKKREFYTKLSTDLSNTAF